MKKILGIGNALVDVVTFIDNDKTLEKFSLPKASMQLVDAKKSALIKYGTKNFPKTFSPGGSAANTIHGIALLGAKTGFIGSIGSDETGDLFEKDFINTGVRPILIRRKTPTGTSVSLVTPDTERTMATHLGAAVELDAKDLKNEYFRGFDILYMEGYLIINKKLVLEACQIAKRNRMKIALDLASYNVVENNLAAFREVIGEYTDIVFANEEEAKAFTGFGPEKALRALSDICSVAVVKTGKKGSMIRRGEEVIKIGVPKVKAVDTTGAGDLYASGFLYGYALKLNLEKCGLIGAHAAAKVIETMGARIDHGKWDGLRAEVKRIIEE